MAQNAYQYENAARALPGQPAKKKVKVKKRYQPAVWTKQERSLVIVMAVTVLFMMLATVMTTVSMQRVDAKNQAVSEKIDKVKEENDSYRGDIQTKTNKDNLEKVAKSANMEQSVNNVRNVNQ
ncbi:cell division protein FtsL [Fructobacillus sp. M1-13]|uniref:Cell division protein FtsL n=1 Tax=Fructobacillus papyriferae TaxID=2713171 RepID=A0ABS5QQ96_9LACO|nr:cell division protein FtsL [Fructobacillus papyriferae]MBS9334499.1 cell division protein FtsL [Fructobacillus papyriferae]MCD2158488.1 cell division protein FtsL [Fructobacillus papyriferae]